MSQKQIDDYRLFYINDLFGIELIIFTIRVKHCIFLIRYEHGMSRLKQFFP